MHPPRKSSFNSFINAMLVDLPAPGNISHGWSMGSILGLCLLMQVVTGIFLAMRYVPELSYAFDSTAYISREVTLGWLARSMHANGASAYFLFMYIHMARGLYYGSYRFSRVWMSGVTMYVASMATAFLGYLLPWGQMSYWGATVITNLFSAIPLWGPSIVEWMWGGFSVGGPTLSRFYAGHFILPLIISGLVLGHLLLLHSHGSSNPLGLNSSSLKAPFHTYFTSKDLSGFIIFIMGMLILSCFYPNLLGDPENFSPANPMVTPEHIKPEWYFLWVYAILRSIPNKLGGVLAMVLALLVLYLLPATKNSGMVPRCILTWSLIAIFLCLTWIGGSPVEAPYIMIGAFSSIMYFICMILFLFT